MLLNCTNCQKPVGGPAINIPENIAHCQSCDHIFRISDAMDEDFNNEHKTNILMPDGIEVVPGIQLDIKLTWRKLSRLWPSYLIGILFTSFPLFVIYLILSDNQADITPVFFVSIFILIGLSMLVKAILRTINTTYITASSFELQVYHKPLNIFGWNNMNIPREEIVQLYVERHIESSGENDHAKTYEYYLLAMLKNSERKVLISGLKKPEVAFYLEHQIEKRLDLDDRPIAGEFIPGKSGLSPLLMAARHFDKMPQFMQKFVKQQIEKEQKRR